MFGFFNKKKKWASTFKHETIAYAGVDYDVRELSVSERTVILNYFAENNGNGALVAAQLIATACVQFDGISPDQIVMNVAPSAIETISEKIIQISGLDADYSEEKAKESQSNQN